MRKKVKISAHDTNDRIAAENRNQFVRQGVYTVNLIGSPGCGKTQLLERMGGELNGNVGVLVGDVKTALDSNRLIRSGHRNAHGIETGGGCHLSAAMIRDHLSRFDLESLDFLFIENVGNLVCPSTFDLGENIKVAVLSVPEGDEKVRKYPALFLNASAVIINKTDLLDIMDYDVKRVKADCRAHNPEVKIFEVSAKTGEGIENWVNFLVSQREKNTGPRTGKSESG